MVNSKIVRFVVWICRKFNREEIKAIISELLRVLNDHNAEVKPRDSFKEEHPHFRDFRPDILEPSSSPYSGKKKRKELSGNP